MLDYKAFKKIISDMIGIDLTNYKSQQMDRRINSLMSLWNVQTYEEYLEVLKTDQQKYKEFVKKLTINVSEFFRNPDRFQELQNSIFPEIIKNNQKTIKIWSAGCSNGSEPYTIAIIAKELGIDGRINILATDIDDIIINKAKEAKYSDNEVRNILPDNLAKYFDNVEKGQYSLRNSIKRMVEFKHQNLLTDPFGADWDLIICRNVVIYFTEEAKSVLYRRFLNALRPGGFLMVGGTEPLLNYKSYGFENKSISFYRRPY